MKKSITNLFLAIGFDQATQHHLIDSINCIQILLYRRLIQDVLTQVRIMHCKTFYFVLVGRGGGNNNCDFNTILNFRRIHNYRFIDTTHQMLQSAI